MSTLTRRERRMLRRARQRSQTTVATAAWREGLADAAVKSEEVGGLVPIRGGTESLEQFARLAPIRRRILAAVFRLDWLLTRPIPHRQILHNGRKP